MKSMENTFYTHAAKSLGGKDIPLETYRGKVVLVVNTASKCGFTPQYAGLEGLYRKYKDRGFVILGFPCNQFGNQEPGTDEEIAGGCIVNYGVSFQMFSKIDVNGSDAHPLFKFLKDSLPGTFGKMIKWNFTKFLIDRNGLPVKRYSSSTVPANLEKDIEKLL